MAETIRVLLVDDEEDFYVLIRELLGGIPGNRYAVDWASSYDAALGVLEADQHAIWLVDYRLGVHDGLELMREAINRGNKAPMVLMTGQGDHEIDMAAMKIGASDYLPKDHIDARTLERCIRYALERSRTQESLQVSEMRFRSAFYGAVPGMALTSADGRFLRVNRSLCDMFGYSVAELLGMSFPTIVHPDDLQSSQRLLETLVAGGQPAQMERRFVHKRGGTVWTYWSVSLLRDQHGGPLYFLSQILDVSERKRTEDALRQSEELLHKAQKMEAVGRLAGGVAHDFNNILTVIGGYATMLSQKLEGNPTLRREVDEIQSSAERAATLTRQLLALSRKQLLDPKVINLNKVVAGIEKMLRRLIGEDVELRMQLDETIGLVKVDPGQIEQVIMNLAINARDAMPSGGKLTIETASMVQDMPSQLSEGGIPSGHYTALIVTDTGTGMSEEVRSHIFEPFFTTKDHNKGTGLGLATCHGIIKQSGGYIHVYTEPGHGSAFKVYLPAVSGTADDDKPPANADVVQTGSETVLLVEDEDRVREFAVRLLRDAGYVVLEARNGTDALRVLHEQVSRTIDIMVTDVIMPQMGGKELADQLKQLRPGTRILFVSGYTGDALDNSGVLQTGAAFLEKPFSAARLTQKIREVLGNGSARKH
ncbi:MAG: response regulator [Verrucomicrobia bacterium]|nr:response regulator [Verrucomicrobiota bacterium]